MFAWHIAGRTECLSNLWTPYYICGNMGTATLDASGVPTDVWCRIMTECGPREIMVLAQCCRFLHELANSRSIWLLCVQNLGAYEPPNLPKYIRPALLGTTELRNATINAHRRIMERESVHPPRVLQEVVLSLKDANPDEVLGGPIEFGLQLFPLPGGDYLLIYWPAGYLQCWSIRDGSCLWLYPSLPEGASEDRPKLLSTFDWEMQENGDLHLLLLDERLQGEELGDIYWSIVRFSPSNSSIEQLQSQRPMDKSYGAPTIVRLRGNLIIFYQQHWGLLFGTLTILFREDNKIVTVTDINVECLEVEGDFIICSCNVGDGSKSLVVFSLPDVFKNAQNTNEPPWKLTGAHVLSAAMLLEPKSFSLRKTELSLNALHWKAEEERNAVYITLLYKDRISKGSPFARFVLNKLKRRSATSVWPLLSIYALENCYEEESPKLSGRTFAAYTVLTPPTLSGRSLALLHSSSDFTESEDKIALATLCQDGSVKFRPLDLEMNEYESETLCTEFYSGAVVFATKDYNSVVIRYYN